MSKQGQQGSNLISQQGLAKSSSESTNFNDSIKEHPSSSAPFGDKKDFEKLSSQSDDQLQQGSVGQQETKDDIVTQQGSSSELKQSSGSSDDIKKGSSYTPQQQESSSEWKKGSSDVSEIKQESFKEHPSSSAPFGDKKEFFEKLSSQSDDQLQQGSAGQGTKNDVITQQGSSSELKQSSGSSDDIKKGSSDIPEQQQESSSELKPSSRYPDVKKDTFNKQQEGSIFGNDEVKWQGPSDETEFNSFGNKVSSDLKQSAATSDLKKSTSDIKGSKKSKTEEGKRDSDLIDFESDSKQGKASSEGAFNLSGEISNLKIDSSSSFGLPKKHSVETGPFYDDKVHDDRNDTK